MMDVGRWADYLLDAEASGEAVAPITEQEPTLTLEGAYAIQDEVVNRKLANGERLVGAKLGLTSRPKQAAMGVDEPLCAWLTDAMIHPAEVAIALAELIHPRVEPEIVFVLGDDLAGPGVTAHDVLDASRAVCCGLEVIDSRFENFRFALGDVVADNDSAARFVLGSTLLDARAADLSLAGCLLEDSGQLVATAAGAAVMGHPAESVAYLANHLGRQGRQLEQGWIVLSGRLTAPVQLSPGSHVAATFAHLGRVGLHAVA